MLNNTVFEKYVDLRKNNIEFIFKKAHKKQVNKLKDFKLLRDNGIIEYPEHGFKELKIICKKIKKLNGGVLFIDYGYKNKNNLNTLQSVVKHRYNDIRENIGNADITSLVNFNLYKDYFNLNDLYVEKIISQSEFLQKLGIIERMKILSKTMSFRERSNLNHRIKRLLHPVLMGESFKVIFAKNKECSFSLAFK